MTPEIKESNERILDLFAKLLNDFDCAIGKKSVDEVAFCGVSRHSAMKFLLSEFSGLDTIDSPDDKIFFKERFSKCISLLDKNKYTVDPYLTKIKFDRKEIGKWSIDNSSYKPYQIFVFDDIIEDESGRIFPQIGYFEEEFSFPAVYEFGRLWMSVVPNEIETMKDAIASARKNVCSIGLGLGYFQYMAHLKTDVKKVTVIERDRGVIELFTKFILPQFDHPEKIEIIESDCFDFLDSDLPRKFDCIFADIWHDVGDGLPLYKKIKQYEKKFPETAFSYWIEKSMKIYL